MRRMSLSIKPLQRVRSATSWFLGAIPTLICPKGLADRITWCLEQEIAKSKPHSKIYDINQVPEFVLTNRVARLPNNPKNSSNDATTLENYDSFLRRAFHAETSEYELLELNDLLMAAERSKILQEKICPRMHVCFIGREGYNPDPIALSNKIEAHMGFSANVSSLVIRNLVDPYRKVQVVMAPNEDGSIPSPRVKYTSVFRELMNFVDDDNKPIFFA